MQHYVICEGNAQHAERIKHLLQLHDQNAIIQIYTSGTNFLQSLPTIQDETVFLMDIVLSDMSGVFIAKQINQHLCNSVIIFISECLEKVVDIYDTRHCYFIFKPELEKRMSHALARAKTALRRKREKLSINLKDKTLILSLCDIHYIERIKRISLIFCSNRIYQCPQDIQCLMEHLSSQFVQCHRSFIVNLEFVQEYKRTDFILNDGTQVPISRAFHKDIKSEIHHFLVMKG